MRWGTVALLTSYLLECCRKVCIRWCSP